MELDGEPISIEQSSPSDRSTGLNQREDFPYFNDSFNNADGMLNHADSMGRIKMVAASAAQNTPDYFDQDTFYPADGLKKFGQSVGQIYGNAAKGAANFLSPEEIAKRKELRQKSRGERKAAKTAEIQSRADLNKAAGQQNPADAEIAKSLGGSDKTQMSTTTKVLIGAGALLVLGAIAYFVINKKK
jgi:hypothetical protein